MEKKHFIKPFQLEVEKTILNADPSSDFRQIQIPSKQPKPSFKSNKVVTARYSILTWMPKSILFQFTRINNIYFLVMSVLSFMPFSPKSPFSLAGTLAAVLIFTMFKEGYEDLARHKQDEEVNKQFFWKYSWEKNLFEEVQCQDIRVGDILKINENQGFPADLVLIGTSDPKGIAFVNTMNLDGETNLKEKVISYGTVGNCQLSNLQNLDFELQVDHPSISLVKWNCNILYNNSIEPMSFKQLLMRGCILKNTEFIYGVAIYTGIDSKIVMNSKKPAAKSSKIQKLMNWILLSVFLLQIFICFILAAFGQKWLKDHQESSYIDLPSDSGSTFVSRILTYWVGYSHLIPISLYVALELVRLFLANFIKNDLGMYDKTSDRTANCRASDLIEELGQVEFVFSDKTGTLTCNEMILRKFSVEGQIYGNLAEDLINDKALCEKVKIKGPVQDFVLMLALCNSVFPVAHSEGLAYQASSPDELALVEAARSLGVVLKERSEGRVFIEVGGFVQSWETLAEIPFDSFRKRMSVILKDLKTNQILLMTKGADSAVLNLCNKECSLKISQINQDLNNFAVAGLRTLVFACKTLSQKDYDDWALIWKEIQISNNENKEDHLADHGALLETDLKFVAVSAIEDKLQDSVPETIKSLMQAGIRLWVLTGDKEQTAIEIAKSCNLIEPEAEILHLFCASKSETEKELSRFCESFRVSEKSSFISLDSTKSSLVRPLALVVNGLCLSYILEDEKLKKLFFFLAYLSKSCICCRVSPAQKMQVVKLAKTYGKWTTLAIGDGANDVSMIQQADIGIGISGKEGTQAVQASDFHFSQFRSLKRLLLVHGRYAYMRISLFILYYFYKNCLSVFTEIWFAFYSGFSGQIFFLDWLPAMYNTFWTSWPCLTFFTLEKDLEPEGCLEFVGLYSAGQRNKFFNMKKFWTWIVFACFSAAWIFWIPVFAAQNGTDRLGRQPGLFWVSTVSFVMLLHTVNLKLLIVSGFWNKFSIFTIFLSFLLFYAVTFVLSSEKVAVVFQPELSGMFLEILADSKTWVVVIAGPVLALMPDFFIKCLEFIYFPNPTQIVMKELSNLERKVVNELN